MPELDETKLEVETPELYPDGYNKIELDDGILPDSKDGEEIEVTIKGTVETKEDGTRCLNVTALNGQPLMGGGEEEESIGDVEGKLDEALKGLNSAPNKFK